MNNDSTPPPAADVLPAASTAENASSSSSSSTEPSPPAAPLDEPGLLVPAQSSRLKWIEPQLQKKHEFIRSLITNLDVLIYMELCILYYMDCSLFRFLLRVVPQMAFLTPKPDFVTPLPPNHQYLGAILVPNLLCVLLHIFTARPEAGEVMRGYLHGGVIIDLIGYKGPTSKLHLVLLDVLVLALQCFMLTVHFEFKMVSAVLGAIKRRPAPGAEPRVEVVSAQDHDAEEQGIVREGEPIDDIGMMAMAPNIEPTAHTEAQTAEDGDGAQLLEDPASDGAAQENMMDVMWSGSVILADFHVLQTIRREWARYRRTSTSGSTLESMGLGADFAAFRANPRLNAASRSFQRSVEALGG